MTSIAWNLAESANYNDTDGKTDAATGLVGAVPIANGGTAASTVVGARTNLGIGECGTYAVLPVANGGTGATNAADARTNLGISSLATLTNIPIANGGTGATTASGARTNLGLGSVAVLSNVPIANGGTGATTAADARTSLGLGTVAIESTVPISKGGTGATDAATARTNLGLGSVATLSVVPVANGGTGATDAATARTNLGLGTVAVESTVPFSKGGTGQTSQQAAMNALAGAQTAGRYLRSDGANTSLAAIQAGDVPTLNQSTTGTASNVTGVVAIANGGTGATDASTARTNLGLPSTFGTLTNVATGAGLTGGPITTTGTISLAGSGVTPGSYVRADITVDAYGRVTSAASGATSGVTNVATGAGLTGGPITTTGTISLAGSGVTAGSYTKADITVDAYGRITSAANGSSAGTVTSVATGTGLTGGTITTTGTISLAGSGVSAGTYNYATVTFDTYGRATSASASSIGSSGQVVYNSGGSLTSNSNMTFDGTNFTCGGNVSAYSDESLKSNWRSVDADFIEKLVLIKHGIYDRTDIDQTQAGVSAQDLLKILAPVVQKNPETGLLSVSYGNAAMVAVIELAKRVLELEKKLEGKQ